MSCNASTAGTDAPARVRGSRERPAAVVRPGKRRSPTKRSTPHPASKCYAVPNAAGHRRCCPRLGAADGYPILRHRVLDAEEQFVRSDGCAVGVAGYFRAGQVGMNHFDAVNGYRDWRVARSVICCRR